MVTKNMLTRILRKNYQGFNIRKDTEKILLSATKEELEVMSFMIIFEEHISEYLKDCLKKLRKFKAQSTSNASEDSKHG